MKKGFTFNGFDPANTTPVPDIFFDVLLPHMNEAQLKVMLYIIRRTLGFKKTEDAISLKQFRFGIVTRDKKQLDNGCGLKNFTTISKALKDLEQMNCVEKVPAKTEAGDDATTVYRIHFRGTARNVVPPARNVVGDYAKRMTGTAPSGVPVLRETYPQETVIQDTDPQETVIQEGIAVSGETDAPTPEHLKEKVDEKIEEVKRITDKHKAVHAANETPYHIADSSAIRNDEEEEDTAKMPAVRLQAVAAGQSPTLIEAVRQTAAPLHTPGTPAPLPLAVSAPSTGRHGDAGSDQASPAPASGRKHRTVPERPQGIKEPPEPPLDAPWGTNTCKQLFDYWRGVTLIGVYKNSQASTCAKGLVERYSREYVTAAKQVMDADKYYIERGGADICEVANNIHKYRKKIEDKLKAPNDDDVADDDWSIAAMLKIQEQRLQREAERGV